MFGAKGERGVKGNKGHIGLLVSISTLIPKFLLNVLSNAQKQELLTVMHSLFFRVKLV